MTYEVEVSEALAKTVLRLSERNLLLFTVGAQRFFGTKVVERCFVAHAQSLPTDADQVVALNLATVS